MYKYISILLLGLVLLGAKCGKEPHTLPEIPKEGGNFYCDGNNYTAGPTPTIINGVPSVDPRVTVLVEFGQSRCSGVALTPTSVLTAAHCGYGASTVHRVKHKLEDEWIEESGHIIHSEYWKWIDSRDAVGRAADLMIVYLKDPLDIPVEDFIQGFYFGEIMADKCDGLFVQGWGQWEGSGLSLREAKYLVTNYQHGKRSLVSDFTDFGIICFGDSGSPLYAQYNGLLFLAGIGSTSFGTPCVDGAVHVNVAFYRDWIYNNIVPK